MTTIAASLRALEIQGTTVPKLGFGTWQIEGPECQEADEDALAIGYRHIDTARAYGNEREVGRGLAVGGVARREFFLTTKIWREE
jgi:2,5-diketo-D-gluconate reductase B